MHQTTARAKPIMRNQRVEISIDTELDIDEYDAFEAYCNKLNVDWDEGFKKIIQSYLMCDILDTQFLESSSESKATVEDLKERLEDTEKKVQCLIKSNEKLEEIVAKLDDKVYNLADVCTDIVSVAKGLNN